MIIQTEKTCSSCSEIKSVDLFKTSLASNGKRYIRSKCKTCWNRDNDKYGDPVKQKSYQQKSAKTRGRKLQKAIVAFDPLTIARRIIPDSRKSDRNRGHENDLDLNFVVEQIQNNCSYCDRPFDSCRMTLDRVDNSVGHLKSNVVPSCQTCNMVRGNMPYDAWLHVAPGMKSARLAGLLDGWDGPRLNRKTVLDSE